MIYNKSTGEISGGGSRQNGVEARFWKLKNKVIDLEAFDENEYNRLWQEEKDLRHEGLHLVDLQKKTEMKCSSLLKKKNLTTHVES